MTYFIGTHKKKPDQQEYDNLVHFLTSETALAERRIAALKRTQQRNPDWRHFNEFAGEDITIDILIDQWEAISEALNIDRRELDRKFNAPKQMVML